MTVPSGSKLNPNRPVNPWQKTNEPDFVPSNGTNRPVPARKPHTLSMPGAFPISATPPPPLPKRTPTVSSSDEAPGGPPILPNRAKSVSSTRPNSAASSYSSSAPQPPLPRRSKPPLGSSSASPSKSPSPSSYETDTSLHTKSAGLPSTTTEREVQNAAQSVAAQVKQKKKAAGGGEVDHLNDEGQSDTSSLSGYKSLV